ncbi:haloacid dehalogenase type II, partial [Candidatus Pelagibacter bacterium]
RTTQLEYTWLRSLMNRHKDFWQVTEDSLDKSMKAYEIDLSMKNELLNLYKVLSPFPEVPEILKRLKEKNYKLGILSNGTPSLLNELVKSNNLDNIFDDIFSIEEVGIYKPDSKVYDMPIKKYKIQKEEVAFLSANTWDVSGGGNYGYSSIWVNRNNNIFDNLDYKPKDEVKNLKQLLDII